MPRRHRNSKPLSKKLLDHLEKIGMSKEELLDIMGIRNDSLFSSKSMFPKPPNKSDKNYEKKILSYQGVFLRTTIQSLYFACHINCEDFLLPKEQEEIGLKGKTNLVRNTATESP